MATHPQHAATTMEAAELMEDGAGDLLLFIRNASRDGGIDLDEAHGILHRAEQQYVTARAVVVRAEETQVRELVAAAILRPNPDTGQVNAHVAKRAQEVGIVIPLFPTREPISAA